MDLSEPAPNDVQSSALTVRNCCASSCGVQGVQPDADGRGDRPSRHRRGGGCGRAAGHAAAHGPAMVRAGRHDACRRDLVRGLGAAANLARAQVQSDLVAGKVRAKDAAVIAAIADRNAVNIQEAHRSPPCQPTSAFVDWADAETGDTLDGLLPSCCAWRMRRTGSHTAAPCSPGSVIAQKSPQVTFCCGRRSRRKRSSPSTAASTVCAGGKSDGVPKTTRPLLAQLERNARQPRRGSGRPSTPPQSRSENQNEHGGQVVADVYLDQDDGPRIRTCAGRPGPARRPTEVQRVGQATASIRGTYAACRAALATSGRHRQLLASAGSSTSESGMDEYRPVKSELIRPPKVQGTSTGGVHRRSRGGVAAADRPSLDDRGTPAGVARYPGDVWRRSGRSQWCGDAPSTFGSHCRPRPRASSSA